MMALPYRRTDSTHPSYSFSFIFFKLKTEFGLLFPRLNYISKAALSLTSPQFKHDKTPDPTKTTAFDVSFLKCQLNLPNFIKKIMCRIQENFFWYFETNVAESKIWIFVFVFEWQYYVENSEELTMKLANKNICLQVVAVLKCYH